MMRHGPRRVAHLGARLVCDHSHRHKLHNVKQLAHRSYFLRIGAAVASCRAGKKESNREGGMQTPPCDRAPSRGLSLVAPRASAHGVTG